MAKPKINLIKLLETLDKQPLRTGKIRAVLRIGRTTEYEIIQEAIKKGWVEQDTRKRYYITPLGRQHIGIWEKPEDSTQFTVFSQVIDPVALRGERPSAMCTLIIEKAEIIKELDGETSSYAWQLTELRENATSIKAALAGVVDSVLDLRAKSLGLHEVRTGEFAEKASSIETYYPGYDYLKRYMKLADTHFRVLVEFNGKGWIKEQNFDDIENMRQDNLDFYNHQKIVPRERRERIRHAIKALSGVKAEHYLSVLLSEERKGLEEHVYKHFLWYDDDKNRAKNWVEKAFKSQLFKIEKKSLYNLKINKANIQRFYGLIGET